MKRHSFFCYLVFFLSTMAVHGQTWTQVWSDEFTSPTINTAYWKFETGNNNGWGNSELQYYTSRPENVVIQNGMLNIIAKKESYLGSSYTSARLKTQGLKNWTYGKVEARLKIPTGKGIWPAFWMLGENITTKSWPACGEIDIMEHVNTEPEVIGTMHWQGPDGNHASYGEGTPFDATKFHVYGIEWNNQAIKWYIDGVKYHEANIANNINSTEEFHAPFFILLNLAVGGQWPGNPDATTVFPDTLSVDYVRVYQSGVTSADAAETVSLADLSVQPNPTNGISSLRYSLPKNGLVDLSLCDALGRKIKTLVAEETSAGDYVLPLNLYELSKGTYIVKGQVGGQQVEEKLIME